MTGELFSLLRDHSILSDLLQGKVEANEAFKDGASLALNDDALPADLFGVRARVLLGQAKKEDAASYASGLLIGADVRIGLSVPTGAQIHVMGRPDLTRLYAAAITQAGRTAVELDGEKCFLAGAREIAKRIDMTAKELLNRYLAECPLIAIVRGIKPEEADAIGDAIYEGGIRIIEVPLNSPDPLNSIERLAKRFGDEVLVGAGTVLHAADVGRIRGCRGQDHRFAGHQHRGDCRHGGGGIGRRPRLFHAVRGVCRDPCRSARDSSCSPPKAATPAVLGAQLAVIPKDVPVMVVGGVKPDNHAAVA